MGAYWSETSETLFRRVGSTQASFLPQWTTSPGLGFRRSQVLSLASNNAEDLAKLQIGPGRFVQILLSDHLYLKKQLTLPKLGRARLMAAVDLHMRQTLPNGGRDLVWRVQTLELGPKDLQVTVCVAKMELLRNLEKTVAAFGGVLSTIGPEGSESCHFVDHRRQQNGLGKIWSGLGLAVILATLGVGVWQKTNALNSLENDIASLTAEKAELGERAMALSQQSTTNADAEARYVQAVHTLNSRKDRLLILRDLTTAISKDTWIAELRLDGARASLTGFSGADVTEVVSDLQNLPWTQRVRLEGPTSFDTTLQSHRFDISIDIKSPQRSTQP